MTRKQSNPGAWQLRPDEVHVWCIALDVPPETLARAFESLDSDERARSARFRFEHDRERFVVAHGALRILISRYLETRPERIAYAYNAFGKPELNRELGETLKFNLSRSGGLAVVAVTADVEIGVDVERIERQSDFIDTARFFFSAAEFDHLMARPSHLRPESFFSCWTKKEACLKASGEGLATSPDRITVPFGIDPPRRPTAVSPASSNDGSRRFCSMYTLAPAPGYIGALAIEGTHRRLSQRSWQPPSWPAADPARIFA